MAEAKIDLRGIEFDVIDPNPRNHISWEIWEGCHTVGLAAFQDAMPARSPAQIATFMGDIFDFAHYHQHPQAMVDDGLVNPDLGITRPHLAVAFTRPKPSQNQIVGFAYSADNVGGATERQRQLRAVTLIKNWRWLEKIAVHPDFQGRGIAQMLGNLTFRQAFPLQPASAYAWPRESPVGAKLLTSWGIADDGGRQPVQPYGPAGPKIIQHRHSARSARGVARRITEQSGDPYLFSRMKKEFGRLGKFLRDLDRDENEAISRNPLGR